MSNLDPVEDAPQKDTLHAIAEHLALALEPLQDAVASADNFRAFLYRMGWDVDGLPPEYVALATLVNDAVGAAESLTTAPTPAEIGAVLDKINAVYAAIRQLQSAPAGPVEFDAVEFIKDISTRLFEILLVDYLAAEAPFLFNLFQMLGVIVDDPQAATLTRPAYMRTELRWEEIPRIFADPASIPVRIYGWGTTDVDFPLMVEHLAEILIALDVPVGIGHQNSLSLHIPVAEIAIANRVAELSLVLVELPSEDAKPAGLMLQPEIPAEAELEIQLTDELKLTLDAENNLQQLFGIFVRPGEVGVRYPFGQNTAPVQLTFGGELKQHRLEPILLLGSAGKPRLAYGGWKTRLQLAYDGGDPELALRFEVDGLRFVLETKELDGFLGSLLGLEPVEIPFSFGFLLSSRTGLSFLGAIGFDIKRSPHLFLGNGSLVVEEYELGCFAQFGEGKKPALLALAAISISGDFHALKFVVVRPGVSFAVKLDGGNAGPFDIGVGYSPPEGVGASLNGAAMSGGGFLDYDQEQGRYAGGLALDVGSLALSAIGLIETKLPDGPGYSFVGLVCAEFTPIQLGLGFTLNGIGGLLGLHRTVSVDALRKGIEDKSADAVMFPENPVARATQIISALEAFFPYQRDRIVAAPMALIGWGTPTLMEAEIALIFDLPAPVRLILLGLIDIAVPDKQLPVVRVRIRLFGLVDFAARTLAIDGELYDSRIGAFTLTGSMAARVEWGGAPNFALAIGGFHPRFQAPVGFPELKRIQIALGVGDNPRIQLQAYLAVTSNSVQFGALVEIYAAVLEFSIYGFLGFDVLARFSPFSLEAQIAGGVALKHRDNTIAAIHLEAFLSGPAPWRIRGAASISLLLGEITVSFDAIFGEERKVELPPADPWPMLKAAIEDSRNWNAELPAAVRRSVTLSAPDKGPLLDPGGAAVFRQTILPLNRSITRLGQTTVSGPGEYRVTAIKTPSVAVAYGASQDFFATAQFENLSDDEKLSLPSFEKMDAGVTFGGEIVFGAGKAVPIVYETLLVESSVRTIIGPEYRQAAAEPPRRRNPRTPLESFLNPDRKRQIVIEERKYVIASRKDGKVQPGLSPPASRQEASKNLSRYLRTKPSERGRFLVVSAEEVTDARTP